jgi:hypothetical protein
MVVSRQVQVDAENRELGLLYISESRDWAGLRVSAPVCGRVIALSYGPACEALPYRVGAAALHQGWAQTPAHSIISYGASGLQFAHLQSGTNNICVTGLLGLGSLVVECV